MTKRRAAYEAIEIVHGGNTVTLRPSLRAATILEQLHTLPALFKAIEDQNFTIISEIILASCSGSQNAAAFLSSFPERPLLPFFQAVQAPLVELVSMFVPAPDNERVQPLHTTPAAKPVTWAQVYAALFDRATGWLGWTPEQAWNSTPTEINRAYHAYIEKLKAIHGSADSDTKQPDPEQAERNIANGLDPEFDRAGLHALITKGKAA